MNVALIEPEREVAAAGHDRTIINIKPEHVDAWLNPDPADLAAMYRIFDEKRHAFYEHQFAAIRGERPRRGNRVLTIATAATAIRILPAMPLPDSFYWTTRSASWPGDPLTVIACQGIWVVSMTQRVDDRTWVAHLDRHRNGPGGPSRRCSSYDQGRVGAELWVTRHQARLREDVAKITAWREAVRANRLAKADIEPPFGWTG